MLLGLHPSASVQDIRQAYRELSKLYHPDITQLPAAIATQKFQQLNEAYATLSNVDRKTTYDLKIGYSRVAVIQTLPSLNRPQPKYSNSSAYIDATDRPLSPGEMFALFILGLTFLGCLLLAITIGFTRGESAFQPITADVPILQEVVPGLNSASDDSPATVAPAIPAPLESVNLSNPT
ncbi:MAG: J domain-containing protein [Phormidesmis sp. CAN_BIN44]|nr:J domain-containing protein [Phormidesmis sp. CAN_BIN44]